MVARVLLIAAIPHTLLSSIYRLGDLRNAMWNFLVIIPTEIYTSRSFLEQCEKLHVPSVESKLVEYCEGWKDDKGTVVFVLCFIFTRIRDFLFSIMLRSPAFLAHFTSDHISLAFLIVTIRHRSRFIRCGSKTDD